MKRLVLTAAAVALFGASGAFAKDNYCDVPENEWQTQEALETKLKEEGWTIKRVKIDGGCYEVYGMDADGKRMETYFDPKTFEVVRSEGED